MDYIHKIISLTKKSPRDPFQVQFKILDTIDMYTEYLPDGKIWLPDMSFQGTSLLEVDSDFYDILKCLLLSIEGYPWSWDLNGKKLDAFGYDFYIQGRLMRLSPTALKVVQEHIGFEPEKNLESIYSQPGFSYGPHLTKISIELEKTSSISDFAMQLHTIHPVRLASFLYESNLSGEGQVKALNLEELQVQQTNETLQINFGEAILVKRITLVLAQDNINDVVALKQNTPDNNQKELESLIRRYARLAGE